jgi:hypothetical protein
MKAIETTGKIEKSKLLKLDEPIPIEKKQKVKIIILYSEDDELIEEKEWLSAISKNPAFAFLKNKKENIYSLADGKPFKA